MQYWQYTEGQYKYLTLTDGRKARMGQRGGYYVIDLEYYVDGFADAEGVGWVNKESSTHAGHNGRFRIGPRSEALILDGETSPNVWVEL